ncbi:2-succinyl-5-enolpyruvyl-6-hydroxy-3-cyclohexene-1-carboxylic-acid synthase [Rothia sp. LK2588]|uniref:2-succinyl-5-enolpyruvyl-6-hydroxy-3- cyclohexene-1-carboxylic-acid synthase n=1 Tax=Rothia sp. LK2588 TaxID=3114369 RepID=UPI0034CF9423
MNTTPLPPSLMSAVSVLDSLVRAGMRHILVSPGSRSAPLAYAVAALDAAGVVTSHVRIDERSAAFTALGLAKATGAPVGVVTTSGTAVGELVPAVMEAYHSGLPLAILSADRPPRLRGTGANQTTQQPGMLTNFVRAEVDLTDYPEREPGKQTEAFSQALATLCGRDAQRWEAASSLPVGPVHLNLAFDTPLTPAPAHAELLQRWARRLAEAPEAAPLAQPTEDLADWLGVNTAQLPEVKTVVVAGDGAGEVAQRFAAKHHLPLLAEPSSGARFSNVAIEAYRQVLAGELGEQIEKVVLFGHPTLSRPVTALLDAADKEQLYYAERPAPWFTPGRLKRRAVNSLTELAELAGRGSAQWLDAWQQAGRQARAEHLAAVRDYRETGVATGRAAGLSLALQAWETAQVRGETLLCGSSNLIRDLDLIAPSSQRAPVVLASRGLAGIDGTLAVASGVSLASATRDGGQATPVRVLCGDLTFLHDVSSLNIGPLELKPRVVVDVLDDRGGGIFGTLEHGKLGQDPGFAEAVHRYFTTPHAVEIERLVEGFSAENGFTVNVTRA